MLFAVLLNQGLGTKICWLSTFYPSPSPFVLWPNKSLPNSSVSKDLLMGATLVYCATLILVVVKNVHIGKGDKQKCCIAVRDAKCVLAVSSSLVFNFSSDITIFCLKESYRTKWFCEKFICATICGLATSYYELCNFFYANNQKIWTILRSMVCPYEPLNNLFAGLVAKVNSLSRQRLINFVLLYHG